MIEDIIVTVDIETEITETEIEIDVGREGRDLGIDIGTLGLLGTGRDRGRLRLVESEGIREDGLWRGLRLPGEIDRFLRRLSLR